MRFPGLGNSRSFAALPPATRLIVESALAVTASVFLARVFWLMAAPQGSVGAAVTPLVSAPQSGSLETAASDTSILTQINAFTRETQAPAMMEAIPETALNLRLVGLRSVTGNVGGSATVELPDGLQVRFEPGDEILTGVKLESVNADRIFLRHGNGVEVLTLGTDRTNGLSVIGQPQQRPLRSAEPPPGGMQATSTPTPTQDVSPAALLADTSMQPETRDGVVVGYKISPRSADGAFAATGLMHDDMVLRVNNLPVEGLTPDRVYAELGSSQQVSLDVVRKGAIVRIRLAPSERPGQ